MQTLGDGLVAVAAGFVAEAPASGGHVVITAAVQEVIFHI